MNSNLDSTYLNVVMVLEEMHISGCWSICLSLPRLNPVLLGALLFACVFLK